MIAPPFFRPPPHPWHAWMTVMADPPECPVFRSGCIVRTRISPSPPRNVAQTESVAKAFSTSASEVALAQMGFVVITIGNRGGNPARSKWYHNYGYGDLRDYGLADKKAGIEQLVAIFLRLTDC